MARKIYIVVIVLSVFSILDAIPHLAEGIRARGVWGVNYGTVVFPLLVGLWAFMAIKIREKNRSGKGK